MDAASIFYLFHFIARDAWKSGNVTIQEFFTHTVSMASQILVLYLRGDVQNLTDNFINKIYYNATNSAIQH